MVGKIIAGGNNQVTLDGCVAAVSDEQGKAGSSKDMCIEDEDAAPDEAGAVRVRDDEEQAVEGGSRR